MRSRVVWARAPSRQPGFVKLGVHPETITKALDDCWNSKLGEYCGLVHGAVWPPKPEYSAEGTSGLIRPTAIYRGLKRPMTGPNLDEAVFAYVTNPKVNYAFPGHRRHTDNWPIRVPVPKNSVFVTFVNFSPEAVDQFRASVGEGFESDMKGVVLFWEWTIASSRDPSLPADFNERYLEPVFP